jgi:hypothetical protein
LRLEALSRRAGVLCSGHQVCRRRRSRVWTANQQLPVATLDFNADPIHFDKDDEWKTRDPSEYDDTFFDLFMLGQSRCVTYSNGGCGSFGQLISYDSNCTIRYFKSRTVTKHCSWTHANGTSENFGVPRIDIPEEMLVEPK